MESNGVKIFSTKKSAHFSQKTKDSFIFSNSPFREDRPKDRGTLSAVPFWKSKLRHRVIRGKKKRKTESKVLKIVDRNPQNIPTIVYKEDYFIPVISDGEAQKQAHPSNFASIKTKPLSSSKTLPSICSAFSKFKSRGPKTKKLKS